MHLQRLRTGIRDALIARGEWLAVAFVGVALAQALLATAWRPYSVDPHEVLSRVAQTRARLEETQWPESERERFSLAQGSALPDLVERGLRAPFDLGELSASQAFHHRLGAERPPLVEPVLHPVQELIASSERVLLPQFTELSAESGETEAVADESLEEEAVPDELYRPGGLAVRRPVPAVRPLRPATVHAATDRVPVGRGFPFVAVRGVVDVAQQVRAYVDAIHEAYPRAERAFEILDFELQRQRQLSGATWSAWEPTDRRVYFDVVRRGAGLAPETVSAEVTDSAITCPLPVRMTGRWEKLATHPRLERFNLSSADLARELEYLKALSLREQESAERARGGSGKRGFAALVRDVHSVEQSVFGRGPGLPTTAVGRQSRFGIGAARPDGELQRLAEELARTINPRVVDRQLVDWIRARAVAERRQLLFRYLDFDVAPGETYRYRVRLELRNPNYGRSLAAAIRPEVIRGATRWTPWSEATPVVQVAPLAAYYLTGLEPARRSPGVVARMHVYQYDPAAGATAEQILPAGPGQLIGGRARTTRANPAKGIIEEGLFEFRSPDALVDGIADLTFSASEHPDLKLPPDGRGRAFVTEMVLVAQPERGLKVIDSESQAPDYARQQQWMHWQQEQLELLRPETWDAAGDQDGATQRGGRSGAVLGPPPLNPLQRL